MFDAIIGFKQKVNPNFGEQLRLAYVKIPSPHSYHGRMSPHILWHSGKGLKSSLHILLYYNKDLHNRRICLK